MELGERGDQYWPQRRGNAQAPSGSGEKDEKGALWIFKGKKRGGGKRRKVLKGGVGCIPDRQKGHPVKIKKRGKSVGRGHRA